MHLILPPSEGKTAPVTGAPLNLSSLLFATELTEHRRYLIDHLMQVARLPNPAQALGLGTGLDSEIRQQHSLPTNPTAPAVKVYTGVLYQALGVSQWADATWDRAASTVRIGSALWGMIRATDRIPAYRLPPGHTLPNGRKPISHLAPAVRAAIDDSPDLVIDMRSGTYVPLWRPQSPWVSIAVSTIHNGVEKSVTHFAKHTRGVIGRALLESPSSPQTAADLVDLIIDLRGADTPGPRILAARLGEKPARGPQPVVVQVEQTASTL